MASAPVKLSLCVYKYSVSRIEYFQYFFPTWSNLKLEKRSPSFGSPYWYKEYLFPTECYSFLWTVKNSENKKVLLRECKRHTARHVASTRYAVLMGWGGGTYSGGGYLPWWGYLLWWGKYLLWWGYLLPHHPDLSRYPPTQTWVGTWE